MGYYAALGILFVAGIGFSLAAFLAENLRKNRVLHFVGLGAFVFLVAFASARMTISSPMSALFAIPALVVGAAPWSFFFAYWAVEFVVDLARSAVGLKDLRVPPGYSPAEAALARRDFAEAERLYRELVDGFPDEAEPCRRLGEVLLSRGRTEEAIVCFREAEKREPDPGMKIMHRFSVAEILADHLGDAQGAVATLEEFAAAYPAGPAHDCAEERLAMMRGKPGTARKDTV